MNKLFFIASLFSLLFLFSCDNNSTEKHDKSTANISIDLSNFDFDTRLYVINMGAQQNTTVDSLLVKNGSIANVELELSQSPDIYILQLSQTDIIRLIVEDKDNISVKITGSPNGISYEVKGSEASQLVLDYSNLIQKHMNYHDSVYRNYRNHMGDNDMDKIRRTTDSLLKTNYESSYNDLKKMVLENPNSLASLLGIYSKFGKTSILDFDLDFDVFKVLSDSLIAHYPTNNHAIALFDRVNNHDEKIQLIEKRYNSLGKGNKFPSLSLKNNDNALINIEENSAKYKIVYLWKPNKKSFYEFNKVFRKISESYDKKEVDIIAIAFEKDMLAWRNYIRMERMGEWTNLIAEANTEEQINPKADYCLVYVLDADNVILARLKSLEDLDEYLK